MLDLRDSTRRLYCRYEIPDITGGIRDSCFRVHMHQGILVNLFFQFTKIALNIQTFKGVIHSSGVASKLFLLLYQVYFMTLFGYGERANHTGDSPAHDKSIVVDGKIKFLQGLQTTGSCDRHPQEVLGLLCRFFFFFLMNPGVVLPDIGHFIVVLVDSSFPDGVPEQHFQSSGGAGRDNHAVESQFSGLVGNFLGGVRRTGKQLLLGIDHVRKRKGVFHNLGNIDYPTDVGPAVTHEHADLRLFRRDIPFFGIDSFCGKFSTPVVQKLADLGASAAGAENGLRNVQRTLETAADEDTRPCRL
ncbi:MAG: hypothetical protein A4E66_01834 [Syntrophus sp. PtaB.Bin001]|nr:MAG: hypothetical protein A4E66_01834 [Syntrophus sp. PtaB.Bin001]